MILSYLSLCTGNQYSTDIVHGLPLTQGQSQLHHVGSDHICQQWIFLYSVNEVEVITYVAEYNTNS